MKNKEIFLVLNPEKKWQENDGKTCRCGYLTCEEVLPCSDCPWWEEDKEAKDDERIFITDMAKNEIEEIKDFNIDDSIKNKVMDIIEGKLKDIDLSKPALTIMDTDGNVKEYNASGVDLNGK